MTDAQTGYTDTSSSDSKSGDSGSQGHTTESHSAVFGLEGQKRASTTAGAGAGSGIIGGSGHVGAANKALSTAGSGGSSGGIGGMDAGGKSTSVAGSGGEMATPSQGTGDVRPAGEAVTGEQKLMDKINPFKK